MTRPRHSPLTAYFLSVMCFVLFATSLEAACNKGQRQDTLHASIIAVDAARDSFVAWDLAHQQAIVERASSKEEAVGKIADYRVTQNQITGWFVIAYQALAVAATQSDEASLHTATGAVQDLLTGIQKIRGGN